MQPPPCPSDMGPAVWAVADMALTRMSGGKEWQVQRGGMVIDRYVGHNGLSFGIWVLVLKGFGSAAVKPAEILV